jgi:hypothetical protein
LRRSSISSSAAAAVKKKKTTARMRLLQCATLLRSKIRGRLTWVPRGSRSGSSHSSPILTTAPSFGSSKLLLQASAPIAPAPARCF